MTNYLDAGVPVHVVRDIAGHNDISVTDKYARRHTSALSLAAESLADYLGRGGQTGGQPSGATRDRTAQ